jgi:hypothetical protein
VTKKCFATEKFNDRKKNFSDIKNNHDLVLECGDSPTKPFVNVFVPFLGAVPGGEQQG